MVATLDGIIIDQFYGDNSGGAEFDTDGDGTATQEDEFVSFMNMSGAPVDISGWEVWSDMTGTGAPDGPQDGLYHTFPPGTVIEPGERLYVVNEISGTPSANMQEASEGGVESAAGGTNTNFLSEGSGPTEQPESVVLLNPSTGEYIILNFSATEPSGVPSQSGFTGTTLVGESNAAIDSGIEDQNAGSSYQYNSTTGSYEYGTVALTCFVEGTLIATPSGCCPIEQLELGELVKTFDHGPQEIRGILRRTLDFRSGAPARHRPIEIKPDALRQGVPRSRLRVSPQHRILLAESGSLARLARAKSLLGRPGIRVMNGCKRVSYFHLVFARHEMICAEGCWSESFYPGPYVMADSHPRLRQRIETIFPALGRGGSVCPARPFLGRM